MKSEEINSFINAYKKLYESRNNSKSKEEAIPSIFGIEYKEVYITQWLSFFLDPTRNGEWYGMINAFLHFDENYSTEVNKINYEETKSEFVFEDGRRIDLLVKTKDYLIAIENKINSDEQKDQTTDYYTSLDKIKGKRKLICIYLKPEYNNSEPQDKMFISKTYWNLCQNLDSLEKPKSERTDWLIKEFKKYVEEKLKMKYPEMSDLVKAYYNEKEIIEYAKREYDNYANQVDRQIEELFNINKKGFISAGIHDSYWQIIKKGTEWRQLDFHIEVFPHNASRFGFADSIDVVIHLENSKRHIFQK